MSARDPKRTLILTPFATEQDSRAARLAAYVRQAGGVAHIFGVAWSQVVDRSSDQAGSPPVHGRLRQRWQRYARAWSILKARHSHYDQVVAVNCELGIVSWLFRAFCTKRFGLVLDVYDHHGDVFESRVLAATFAVLEMVAAAVADTVVLPISERLAQYPKWAQAAVSRKALYISNIGFEVPCSQRFVTGTDGPASADAGDPVGGRSLKIAYCGNVDFSRGLDLLIAAVGATDGRWQLDVHGGGVALAEFERLPAAGGNVRFHGPFRNAELVERAGGADLFWAAYDLRVANNRYCDPNKFRDHIVVDVPILTNPGHPLAGLVERSGSGFVVPLDVGQLRSFLATLKPDELAGRRPSAVQAEAVLSSIVAANREAGCRIAFGPD